LKPFRIISKIDIKNYNVVKSVNLEGLRVLGRAEDFAKIYYNDNIDEIIYHDTVASLYGKNNLINLIKNTAKNIFVPLTVSGGIRSLNDIKNVLEAGADKVSVNSEAIKRPAFLKEASREFGSSTISLSIEGVINKNGDLEAYYENGRTPSGIKVSDWILKAQDYGVGEIILIFVDTEGTGKGINILNLKKIEKFINVPLIVNGGIGNLNHMLEIAIRCNFVSGIAIGSLLHYSLFKKILRNNVSDGEGNFDFIMNNNSHKKFKNVSVKNIKKFLEKNYILCRN
jgi:cyclase